MLTERQNEILKYIKQNGATPISIMAKDLCVTKTAIYKRLKLLVKKQVLVKHNGYHCTHCGGVRTTYFITNIWPSKE